MDIISSQTRSHYRPYIVLFSTIYIAFALILVGLFYVFLSMDASFELNSLIEQDSKQTEIAAYLIQYDQQQARSEVLVLTLSPTLKNYVESNSNIPKSQLNEGYSNLINQKTLFNSILLMDSNNNIIVNHSRSDTTYIPNNIAALNKQILSMPEHTIHISLITNNPQSYLLFSSPIYDSHGVARGSIHLGLSSNKTSEDFQAVMKGKHTAALVNQDGNILTQINGPAAEPLLESFAASFPLEWSQISQKKNGFVLTHNGLFSFTTIYPLLKSDNTANALQQDNFAKFYTWKIISYIPNAGLPHPALSRYLHSPLYFLSLFLLAILSGFMTYMIQNKRNATRNLRKSMQEIEDLYDHAPCGYHSLDENGLILRMNTTELNWLGYHADEVIGKMIFPSLLTPESGERFKITFPLFKKNGVMNNLEVALLRKNGTIFHALLSATAVRDKHGRYIMSRSTMTDISKRKQVEEALRESEERFRTAMDNAPIGIAIVALDGHFIQVNRALCSILGYSNDELLHLTFQQITHPDDLQNELANLEELLADKVQSYQLEKRFLPRDGNSIWIQITSTVVRNNLTKEPLHYIAQIEDITERKLYQERIHELAYHDTLTQLPNRQSLLDRLNQSVVRAERNNEGFAVLFIDLNKFKYINDTYGHDVGDALLKIVAARIVRCVRRKDTVSRPGGDEFILIISDLNHPHDVEMIVKKICASLNEPIKIDAIELNIAASIGIALYPIDGKDATQLMKSADIAMYNAKKLESTNYQFYYDKQSAADINYTLSNFDGA